MNRVLEDVELVFHEAAIPSVPRSVENPEQTHIASVDGTFSLLLAAKATERQTSSLRSVEFGVWRSTNSVQS